MNIANFNKTRIFNDIKLLQNNPIKNINFTILNNVVSTWHFMINTSNNIEVIGQIEFGESYPLIQPLVKINTPIKNIENMELKMDIEWTPLLSILSFIKKIIEIVCNINIDDKMIDSLTEWNKQNIDSSLQTELKKNLFTDLELSIPKILNNKMFSTSDQLDILLKDDNIHKEVSKLRKSFISKKNKK